MQKLVYVSNSRDFTNQADINENIFFQHINSLLEDGWKVAHLTPNAVELSKDELHKETFAALVLLEKPDQDAQK